MLEPLGYRVVTAKNGLEALARCRATSCAEEGHPQIDLVITDLVMPEMGGEALLRELRKTHPTLPVLAVTGHALQKDDLDQLKETGFVGVLSKPFDMEQLARVVKHVARRLQLFQRSQKRLIETLTRFGHRHSSCAGGQILH